MIEKFETPDVSSPGAYPVHSGLGLVAQLLGAALSLALVIGIGIWAYKLIIRDVAGVPVIAASKEPMRVAPEDPGGVATQNQGLSVSAVAEEGRVVEPEQVTLAPRPVILLTDDRASKDLYEEAKESMKISTLKSGELDMDQLADEIVNDKTNTRDEGIKFEIDQVNNAVRQALEIELELPARFSGDLPKSLRPKARPVTLTLLTESNVMAMVKEIAPKDIPLGTALVQLGAFDTENIARTEWARLSAKFSSILSDRARVIQTAERGGRTFYRLRALGFSDLNDARRFCALLIANSADCIPVTVR